MQASKLSHLSLNDQKKGLIFYFLPKPVIMLESVRMQSAVTPDFQYSSFRYIKETSRKFEQAEVKLKAMTRTANNKILIT